MFLAPLIMAILTGCSLAAGSSGGSPSATALSTALASAPASTSPGPSWKLAWQDNFTGTGSLAGWQFTNTGSNQSLEWFQDSNATQSSHGGLVITADKGGAGHTCWYGPCEYTSAEISSSYTQEYGLFEARIKLPSGAGLWPAFWMLPPANQSGQRPPGEIDIIEVNNKDSDEVSGYAHDGPIFSYKAEELLPNPPSAGFHVYGVEWTPTGISWLFDGKTYGHISAFKGWPFDQPFYMIIDLAVGGSWPGSPTAATVFPAKLQVSWVRAYKMAG